MRIIKVVICILLISTLNIFVSLSLSMNTMSTKETPLDLDYKIEHMLKVKENLLNIPQIITTLGTSNFNYLHSLSIDVDLFFTLQNITYDLYQYLLHLLMEYLSRNNASLSYQLTEIPLKTSLLTATQKKFLIMWYLSVDNNLDEVENKYFPNAKGAGSLTLNVDAYLINHILAGLYETQTDQFEILLFRDANNDYEATPNTTNKKYVTKPLPVASGLERTEATLYKLRKDKTLQIIWSSPKETNFATQSSLEYLLDYALSHYDPKQYYLILMISDHGGAWKGIGKDEQANDYLTLNEVHNAIRKILNKYGVNKLDALILEACIMSTAEVYYHLKDIARYIVASESSIAADGYAYAIRYAINKVSKGSKNIQTFLQGIYEGFKELFDPQNFENLYIKKDQKITGQKYGLHAHIIGYYAAAPNIITYLDSSSSNLVQVEASDVKDGLKGQTITIIDTNLFGNFMNALNQFIQHVYNELKNYRKVHVIREYYRPPYITVEYGNMKYILSNLALDAIVIEATDAQIRPPHVQADLKLLAQILYRYDNNNVYQSLITTIDALTIYLWSHPAHSSWGGITIYYPYKKNLYDNLYDSIPFAFATLWDELFDLYYDVPSIHYTVTFPIM